MTLFDTIAPALAGALAARGYETLTPVQQAMLAEGAGDRDLLVSAQTGSCKTVAFGIAIAPTLLGDEGRFSHLGHPQALIIAPTRELALQVRRELEWLYAATGAQIASCVGGMDIRSERRALERGAHIVVGTPGRLRDHITRGALDMSELRAVVLDEADEMLDLGFREDLEFILDAAPPERRTLMFSATVPKQIAHLAQTFQRDAMRIQASGEGERHADIEYKVMMVAPTERENAIINALLYFDAPNAIVFCHTREAVKHLAARLTNRGFAVVALSGELSQAERTNALQSMRDGRARVCVATDVAARGIDLPNLDLVIHADLPTNPDTLLHRSGRTGRAGRKGICALIVPHHRRSAAQRVFKLAKLDLQPEAAPSAAMIEERQRQTILNDAALSVPVTEDEAEVVAALVAAHSPEAIAAAYLRQQKAKLPPPEDLSDAPVYGFRDKPERKDRFERPAFDPSDSPAPARFSDGIWFRVSLGRKQRAEPRWLLPLLCKAGHVTKREIGSIKIFETESQFEIAPDRAEGFARAIKEHGTGEKGVTISRIEGAPGEERKPRKPKGDFVPRQDFAPREEFKPKAEFAPKGDFKPKGEFKPKKPFKLKGAVLDQGPSTPLPRADKPKYKAKPRPEAKPGDKPKPYRKKPKPGAV